MVVVVSVYIKIERKDVMQKNMMILFGVVVVVVLVVAGFTLLNNDGTSDSSTNRENEDPLTNDNSNTSTTGYGSIVGNWTFLSGTSNGEPVTHIVSGWVNYKSDGTWVYSYDYGYTTVDAEGTWQTQDGQLAWGTNGSEISDWYSVDSYDFVDGDLVISSSTSEMRYRGH